MALRNRDTLLAVLLRPVWFELALEPARDGDDAVEPLMLVLLPFIDEPFSHLSPKLCILFMETDDKPFDMEPPPLRRSIDIAWRLLASNWRAAAELEPTEPEPSALLRISLMVEGAFSLLLLPLECCLFGLEEPPLPLLADVVVAAICLAADDGRNMALPRLSPSRL